MSQNFKNRADSSSIPAGPAASMRLPRPLEIILAVVVLLELAAPFFDKSYGVDGPSQLNLVAQFAHLFSHGVLFPRWAPQGVFGFGIGSFYFYPPITFYIGGLVHVVSGIEDAHVLYQMTGLVATILCFFSARPLLRALGGTNYAVNVGALLYSFAPLQIAELYSRSSLSSHVAYIFVPLVWYGLLAIAGRTRLKRVPAIVVLGVSSALSALTSVPLTLAMIICIAIVALTALPNLRKETYINAIMTGFLALALAAFHFMAVLSARPYAQLQDLTVVNPEYLLTDLLHGTDLAAGYHVGILYLTWILVALALWRTREKLSARERTVSIMVLAVGTFIALMEIPFISQPLLAHVSPFTLIQGSWRFYVQFLIAGVAVLAVAKTPVMQRTASAIAWIWVLGAIGPALLILFNLHIFPHVEFKGTDPTEYLPVYTIHAQKQGYGQIEAHQDDPVLITKLESGEHLQSQRNTPKLEIVTAKLNAPHLVTFHRFYWPFWHLYANGHEIPSRPDSLGRAAVTLPAGNYTATWQLERTPLETAGLWISGISWACVLFFFGIGFVRKRVRNISPAP